MRCQRWLCSGIMLYMCLFKWGYGNERYRPLDLRYKFKKIECQHMSWRWHLRCPGLYSCGTCRRSSPSHLGGRLTSPLDHSQLYLSKLDPIFSWNCWQKDPRQLKPRANSSISQLSPKRLTLSSVGGTYPRVPCMGALYGHVECEGGKTVRIHIKTTSEYPEYGNQVSPNMSPLQGMKAQPLQPRFIGVLANASYLPLNSSMN